MIKLYKELWTEVQNDLFKIYFTGYFFYEDKYINDAGKAAQVFQDIHINDLSRMPEKFIGNYSLIIEYNDYLFLISDIIRSQPLFYGKYQNDFFVTDELAEFQQEFTNFSINTKKIEEYIISGYTYGYTTVFENIYGIQAGEIVVVKDGNVERKRYFEYKPQNYKKLDVDDAAFVIKLDTVLKNVFARMLKSSTSSTRWIVPLSGGHDSRIIVNYLYKAGVKNVICYTYGTSGNKQSSISEQIANMLGYEWHFVEYTAEKWHLLHCNGLINDYIDFSFNGVSISHLQDFLAICELKEKCILLPGDIIVPGHTFDFLTGGHLTEEDLLISKDNDAVDCVRSKYAAKSVGNNKFTKQSISDIYTTSACKPVEFKEYFNWQERQAKFIVNSIRVYEFFGFDSRIPLWDKELVEFWLSIDVSKKANRKIFYFAEKNGLLSENLSNIQFVGKAKKDVSFGILKLIPQPIISLLSRFNKRKVKLNEGLNNIYALEAASVEELLQPVSCFPPNSIKYFRNFLKKYPYQINYHFLTALYTVSLLLKNYDFNKTNK